MTTKWMYKLSVLYLFIWLFAGCAPELEPEMFGDGSGAVTFDIGAENTLGVNVNSRGEEVPCVKLSQLWYTIADEQGRIQTPHYQKLETDFSRLTIEGLKHGDYTIAFLAATGEGPDTEREELAAIQDVWLKNRSEEAPVDGEYYYKKIRFSIGKEQKPIRQEVVLDLCVGRVELDIKVSSDYIWRFIKSIQITFDSDADIPVRFHADGEYSGVGRIRSYDITSTRSFSSFPSDTVLSGFVEIESERSNGDTFSFRYRFTDCKIEAGKISHIEIDYCHPENEEGLLYVREEDYSRFETDTMFMADEPKEVFYDAKRRSFYVDAPLQVSITDDHKLGVKFFAPTTIRNVRVMCRFGKVSHEFLELAHFDVIYPFMEGSFTLPVVERDAIFVTASGRKIRIPAQGGLTNDDVTLTIETDDPFMTKIARINSHWLIRFAAYGADSGHAYWRHMTPLLCRHGVALALNMAYMFSSDDFSTALDRYEGILYDNAKNPIDLNNLRTRIRNHAGLVLGRVVSVGGLGGGTTYGLADYCYTGVYYDATAPGSNPHNYPRQAMFHEYGHCLGYSHSSNMTYGNAWTVLCANVFVSMGEAGKLPVNSKNEVAELPM